MVVMRAFPSCQGASPLTRGKQVRVKEFETGKGRIPAHAGKTNFAELKQLIDRAHPRSRGENPRAAIASALATGASPLTRGKRIGGRRKVGAGRRIPAHAGKTTAPSWRSPPSWAHPRSRGENVGDNWAHMTCGGASPLTRGKLGCERLGTDFLGRIPAHAGKTVVHVDMASPHPAHPRSRGENPPLAAPDEPESGRIPAHAGKTFSCRV